MSRCNTPADCGIRLILAVNHCDVPVTAVCRYIKREHWSCVLDIAVWSPAVSLGLANQSDRRHKQRTPFTNSRRIFLSQLLENGVPIPREAPLLLLLLFFLMNPSPYKNAWQTLTGSVSLLSATGLSAPSDRQAAQQHRSESDRYVSPPRDQIPSAAILYQ